MLLVVVPLALSLLAPPRPPSGPAVQACNRVNTTTLVFGRDGGNIRPAIVTVAPDGVVADSTAGTSGALPVATVRKLARLAWSRSFASLRTTSSARSRLKDESTAFIEARSACGTHRVERQLSQAPKIFRDLYRQLERARKEALPARAGS